ARLDDALGRLERWTLATPPAVDPAATPAEIDDSIATSIFNVWAVKFLDDAFSDELSLVNEAVDSYSTTRAGLMLFASPGVLVTGLAPETGEPVLCDDLGTNTTVESCTLIALMALDEALVTLESPDVFGTADMSQWRWGKVHTLTLTPLLPSRDLA